MRPATHEETKKKHPMPNREAGKAFSPKIKAKIMAKWSKISEGDVDSMNGSFTALASKIQELYSYPKVKSEKECEEFRRANKLM